MSTEDAELKRVRWRCRRGMRELDRLFDRWLAEFKPQQFAFVARARH